MNTVINLLAECDTHGIKLMPDGDNGLDYNAPEDALTPALLERLKASKGEILAVLQVGDLSTNPQPCPSCGSGVLCRLPDGQVVCACTSTVPMGAVKVVHARLPDGDVWEDHPSVRVGHLDGMQLIDPGDLDADGWPLGSIPWPAPGDPWLQETSATEAEIVPGSCDKCGCTEHFDVPIHDGQSTRRDCTRCGRTHGFPVWNPPR